MRPTMSASHRFLITAKVRRGSEEAVRALLREGPPFQLPDTSLERHTVFLSGDEIVFLFEGPRAEEEVRRLLHDRTVLGQASRIGLHLSGRPRMPEEVFSWTRPELVRGLSFGPLPGPGDSEGGAWE
jgi:hypothetical protein